MNKRLFALPGLATLTLAFSLVPLAACAQVPVDEHGEVLGPAGGGQHVPAAIAHHARRREPDAR